MVFQKTYNSHVIRRTSWGIGRDRTHYKVTLTIIKGKSQWRVKDHGVTIDNKQPWKKDELIYTCQTRRP